MSTPILNVGSNIGNNPFISEDGYGYTNRRGQGMAWEKRNHYQPIGSPPGISSITINDIIDTIPNFSGDIDRGDNIEIFLNSLQKAANIGAWGDEIKLAILNSKLRGKALKTYNEGIGLIFDVQYEEVRQHMLNIYKPRESTSQKLERICGSVQGVDEPVEAFYFRLRGIVKTLPFPNEVMQQIMDNGFVDGLRHDIRKFVILSKPNNAEHACSLAKEYEEREWRMGKTSVKVANVSHENKSNMNTSECETRKIELCKVNVKEGKELRGNNVTQERRGPGISYANVGIVRDDIHLPSLIEIPVVKYSKCSVGIVKDFSLDTNEKVAIQKPDVVDVAITFKVHTVKDEICSGSNDPEMQVPKYSGVVGKRQQSREYYGVFEATSESKAGNNYKRHRKRYCPENFGRSPKFRANKNFKRHKHRYSLENFGNKPRFKLKRPFDSNGT